MANIGKVRKHMLKRLPDANKACSMRKGLLKTTSLLPVGNVQHICRLDKRRSFRSRLLRRDLQ